MRQCRQAVAGLLVLACAAGISVPAAAESVTAAFRSFCASHPGDCQRRGGGVDPVAFAAANWSDLGAVNARVNRRIRARPDMEIHGRADVWSLGEGGVGDCEDYALAKRHELLRRGWPSSALLIAVVRDRTGEGHAVLLVPTASGHHVLDSRTEAIRPIGQTPYVYFLRQSAESPRRWVSM
jgi:predicted transglutaminase-like cysteine proteinase